MTLTDPIVAILEDVPEIAQLHYEATHSTKIYQLVYGNSDPLEIQSYLETVFKLDFARPSSVYLVVKDDATKQIASYVKWEGPYPAALRAAELQEISAIKPSMPSGTNKAFQSVFVDEMMALRGRVLGDPKRDAWGMCVDFHSMST